MKTVEEAKDIFFNITKIKAKTIEEIYTGFSNQNFLINNKYILRLPLDNKDESINYIQENKVYSILKESNINEKLVFLDKNGVKITKFIKNAHLYENSLSDLEIKRIGKLLKKLHQIKGADIQEYDPLLRLQSYKKIINQKYYINNDYENFIKFKFSKICEKTPLFLSHNDLVRGNLLIKKDKIILIDWEYAALNIEEFDLASLISENNLAIEQSNILLKSYYGNKLNKEIKNRVYIVTLFQDILFYYWALYMLKRRNFKIYKMIANEKKKKINKSINQHDKLQCIH